jgi:hypothetical protein
VGDWAIGCLVAAAILAVGEALLLANAVRACPPARAGRVRRPASSVPTCGHCGSSVVPEHGFVCAACRSDLRLAGIVAPSRGGRRPTRSVRLVLANTLLAFLAFGALEAGLVQGLGSTELYGGTLIVPVSMDSAAWLGLQIDASAESPGIPPQDRGARQLTFTLSLKDGRASLLKAARSDREWSILATGGPLDASGVGLWLKSARVPTDDDLGVALVNELVAQVVSFTADATFEQRRDDTHLHVVSSGWTTIGGPPGWVHLAAVGYWTAATFGGGFLMARARAGASERATSAAGMDRAMSNERAYAGRAR